VTYVAGTAASYVILGAAMVDSEVPAAWAGWVAIVVGALTILGSVFTRGAVTFPELPLVVPIVIGVAFLVA
jgi:multidrug transporter EmrE-like cation transporter